MVIYNNNYENRFILRESDFLDYDTLNEEAIFTNGNLPHRSQQGKLQFITFRTADSLPAVAIEEIKGKITEFEKQFTDKKDKKISVSKKFKSLQYQLEKYIDRGEGRCELRNEIARKILIDLLVSGDGKQYDLFSYVIMPNHVHVLLREIVPLPNIMNRIKGDSSYHIGKIYPGFEWMDESWDTMIRHFDGFLNVSRYIMRNPKGLPEEDFTIYLRRDLLQRYFRKQK